MKKHSSRIVPITVLFLTFLFVAVFMFVSITESQKETRTTSQASQGYAHTLVTSGNKLLLDGKEFIPQGLIVSGSLVHANPKGLNQYLYDARDHFSPKLLDAAKDKWGVNTLRYNINQAVLDPKSPQYNPKYIAEIKEAVDKTAYRDIVIILAMFSDPNPTATERHRMPTEQTKRAWKELAPVFTNYPRVMFELFNEPGLFETNANWEIWKNGGEVPAQKADPTKQQAAFAGFTAVGHQELLNYVSNLGSRNVIIVDGLFYSRSLNENYTLSDPMNRIAYAVHPFFSLDQDLQTDESKELWEQRFGKFSEKHPVIATAWSSHNFYKRVCRSNAPELSKQFFEYMQAKRIGVIGWSIDVPGTLVKDWEFNPTDFKSFTCDKLESGGGGAALKQYFDKMP